MRIEVTGKDFELPKEAKKEKFPYEAIAISFHYDNHREIRQIMEGDVGLEWARRVLEHGPQEEMSGFAYAAAKLANSFSEPIELILNGRKPSNLGSSLRNGKIIVRGDLNKETGSGMWGGYIFVDGDIAEIDSPHEGVIYVRGDVGAVKNLTHNNVLIVGGKIHNSHELKRPTENPAWPSPFIFTTQPVEIFGYPGYGSNKRDFGITGEKLSTTSNVLPENFLKGWQPEDLERLAMELCRKSLNRELDKKRDLIEKLDNPMKMSRFYNEHINGYSTGYGRGHYQGVCDTAPDSD